MSEDCSCSANPMKFVSSEVACTCLKMMRRQTEYGHEAFYLGVVIFLPAIRITNLTFCIGPARDATLCKKIVVEKDQHDCKSLF